MLKLKNYRFKKNEISLFLKDSKKIQTEYFSIFYKTDQKQTSFAFISPKRLGSAPKRNHIKRRLKACFQDIVNDIQNDTSLILIAKDKFIKSNFKITSNMLLLSLKKRNLVYESSNL